jgi:putative hydrolase of the HAD superfamily
LKEIKAVIFDLDDTLLDRSRTFEIYCEYLINKYFTNALQNKKNIISMIKEMDKNGYESRNIFYKKIIDNWNLNYTVEELENNWFEQFDKFYVPMDKLIEILEYLDKKYKLAIITNGSNNMQNRKIDALGIRKYFDEIIISNDVGMKKPEKEIFLLSCDGIEIIPSKVVYVGDNYEIDIMGSVNAGLKAIWINKFEIDINYENTIKKLIEIKKIL